MVTEQPPSSFGEARKQLCDDAENASTCAGIHFGMDQFMAEKTSLATSPPSAAMDVDERVQTEDPDEDEWTADSEDALADCLQV